MIYGIEDRAKYIEHERQPKWIWPKVMEDVYCDENDVVDMWWFKCIQ